MTRFAILGAGLVLAGCTGGIPDFRDLAQPAVPVTPVVAAPPPPPPEVRLVSAIEEQGCVLTAGNAGAVLLAANMTQSELADTVTRLEGLGRVQATGDGGIRVVTNVCA